MANNRTSNRDMTSNRSRTSSRSSNRDQNRDYNRDYEQGNRGGYGQNSPYYFETFYTPDEDFYPIDYWDNDFYPENWTYTEAWYVPGPFVGYGPEDYQRQDENIREDVNERLKLHGQIDARQIHVQVDNGEVTLTGNVNSRKEKRMAEDIADSVSGVKDVHNELHIQQKQQNQQGQKQQDQKQLQGSH